jgi:membrane protease subunit HflC
MRQLITIVILVAAVALLAIVTGAFYQIQETEQVLVTQFGKPVGDPVTTPGIHLKIPLIQKANYFEKRFLEWDGDPNQIPTKDKRFIHVDTYARWQISDVLLFRERNIDEDGAQSRLDDILDGETRNTVAKHALIEVVRSTNRAFAAEDEVGGGDSGAELQSINFGRSALAEEVLAGASPRLEALGILLLDFRFKRIGYVEEVQREIFSRMISERKRIAEQFRSEGAGESARINGEKDRKLKTITSEAYREAQEIKGKADAEAADIYAAAYNKDPEFYRFIETMETYRDTMDADTTLVLTTDGDFYRYLNRAK